MKIKIEISKVYIFNIKIELLIKSYAFSSR